MPSLHLSHTQAYAIVQAYRIGGMALAAVVLQESSACERMHGADPLGVGCSQIHLATARGVTHEPIGEWMLASDWQLNMAAGEDYLVHCANLFGWPGAFTCYHLGVPAARAMGAAARDHSDYVREIDYRIRQLESLPISED